jgi:3-hydroxyisobutyrate dehydrogenase-like beta-hydroxyacid dehydrogenase
VLGMLATTVERVGPWGAAQVVKLANNVQTAVNGASLAQALRFALAGGVTRAALDRVLPLGSSASRAQDLWLAAMLQERMSQSGSIGTLAKDLALAVEYADSVGEPATIGAAAMALFEHAAATVPGTPDVPALVDVTMRDQA